MADLPLLPQQQRTTTLYNFFSKKGPSAVFRPKLTDTARDNLQSAHDVSVCVGNRQVPLHRAMLMTGLRAEPRDRVALRVATTVSLHRALHWLMYQEEQERAVIQSNALSESPMQCYFSDWGECESFFPWRVRQEPPIITTEEELREMTRRAFKGVFWRIGRQVQMLHQLEEAEAFCRQRDLVEPIKRSCMEIAIVQELLKGKLLIWQSYLQQLEVWRRSISIIKEEKIARVSVLSHFVSCSNPLPCRCLLWDLEILEESAIPLEPEVNRICLFVSIVIQGSEALQAALLAKREEELLVILEQQGQVLHALDTLNRIRQEEQERFDSLGGYHAFCVKLLNQESERMCVDCDLLPSTEGPQRCGQVWRRQQRRRRHRPPVIDYYKYLHVVKTVSLERETRDEIEACEFAELTLLMYRHESACRCAVVAVEELARRQVVVDVEAWERHAVLLEEATALQHHVRPSQFQHEASAMMRTLQEQQAQMLQYARASVALVAIGTYEHRRRAEIMLLETKVRTESRLLFHRTSGGAGRHVVERWMLRHEMQVVMREEERLRIRIVDVGADKIATHATAHGWMVDYNRTECKAAWEHEQQCARSRLMVEQEEARITIESLWLQECVALFETKLCIPTPAGEPTGNATRCNVNRRKTLASGLDIRQFVITSLSDFLGNDVLLAIFAHTPAMDYVV